MSDIQQEYTDIVQEVRGAFHPGRLKLQTNAIIFKNIKTGKVDQHPSGDIDRLHWLKRARGCCLKVMMKNGTIHRYDGFKDGEFEKLSSFTSKNYDVPLEKVDLSLKGWNWGLANFVGNSLTFEIDNHLGFDVPLNNVSHSTTAKNEVTLEFHQNDDAAVSLTELRFHIPSDSANPDTDPVQTFYQSVLDKADIIQATGDAIASLTEIQCLTPRGRYDIKLYPTFLQLHGKTFDYKIPYNTILRLFLLPHKDGRQMFFVVSLDPPIKQGQTRYHFLILLFNKEEDMTLEMGLSDDEVKKQYGDKLSQSMTGPTYEIVSKVFKAITNTKITVPGNFVGHSGTQAISCSYKASNGLLYPLERGFIFVHKPPVHIRYEELASVNFARSAGSTRSFDFDVETKSGTMYTFVGIEKEEYGKLYDYVTSKKLRVKNIGGKNKDMADMDMMDMDSDEEGGHDAYLERMKAEGKQRDEDDDDLDSDESDESYVPENENWEQEEVAEEYDSNPPTTSSSDEEDSEDEDSDEEEDGEEESEERRERRERKEREKEKKKKEKEKRKEKEKKRKSAKTVSEDKPRKKRKSKKETDPDRPKRPQTAYFRWMNENRESLKEQFPGLSVTELTKKAGELWKDLEDRSKWEKEAEEDKLRYQEAMKEYKGRPAAQEASSPTKSSTKSPKKSADSKAGSGGNYKSKEYISSSEDSSDSDKPLKKKEAKKEKKRSKAEEPMEEEASAESARDSGSASEEDMDED